jgi:hypothetical protein
MARGESGRVVVEIDPDLKSRLYGALTERGLTLKAWFVDEAQRYIELERQPLLFSRDSASHRRAAGVDGERDG